MLVVSILIALILVDLLVFVNDKYILSFLFFVGSVIFTYHFFPTVGTAISSEPWENILKVWLPTYAVAGLIFTFIKWLLFVAKEMRRYKEELTKYLALKPDTIAAHGIDFAYAGFAKTKKSFIYDDSMTYDQLVVLLIPRAKDHVDRISFWFLQWPLVIVGTLIEDFLLKVGKHIARLFDEAFKEITKAVAFSVMK